MSLSGSSPGRILAVVGLSMSLGASAASAATLKVTTTADRVSSADHACSLREAIAAVTSPGTQGDCGRAGTGANTILLGAHVYPLSVAPSGADDNSSGDLNVLSTHPLAIVGAGVGNTTVSAAGLGDRAFDLSAATNVMMLGLTITGGRAPDGLSGQNAGIAPAQAGVPGGDGGAIANAGTLVLIRDAVTNSAAGNGGSGGSGAPTGLVGATGGNGGQGGGIYNTGTLALNSVTVSGNRAGNGGPGGAGGTSLVNGGGGGSGGCCGDGGGIANAGGTVTVANSTVDFNRAGSGGSGGAGGPAGGPGTPGPGATGSAGPSGGGIASEGGALSITDSTIVSNTSGAGGNGGAGGTQAGSTAAGGSGGAAGRGSGGGGVYVGAGSATLTNATVTGDAIGAPGAPGGGGSGQPAGSPGAPASAGLGGGIYGNSSSAVRVRNTLLASNQASNCAGLVADAGHDLSFGAPGCPVTFPTGDPRLRGLQDNGGPTATVGLAPGSAAIDRVPALGSGCPVADQRGVPRPSGSACDIGAYEVSPPAARTIAVSHLTGGGATLNGAATPNAGAAGVEFDYGRTAAYGSHTPVQSVGGVQSMPFSAVIGGLRPRTTYHYRIVVSSPDGRITGGDQTFSTAARTGETPRLGRVTIAPGRFRAGPLRRRGRSRATISYTDTLPARATFVLRPVLVGARHSGPCAMSAHGHGHTCPLITAVGSFSHQDRKGHNTLRFDGRLGHRWLKPGRYRVDVTPRFAGLLGRTVSFGFTVF